eukprot:GILJ01015699.1.p1 GENE.GILJ01015699.1~~GILJ01015699.1.p1  ORF type:complete len:784 (-),score=77.31 GILJ01015699.1:536-2887(-)
MSKLVSDAKQYNGSKTRATGGFVAYADDLTIWLTDHDPKRLFLHTHAVTRIVTQWAHEEGIKVSSKTEAMLCTPLTSQPGTNPRSSTCPHSFITAAPGHDWDVKPATLEVDGLSIPFKESIKFLGIRLNNNMRSNPHADYLSATLSREISSLKHYCHFLTPPLRAIVMGGLVGSKARYLLSAWWHIAPVASQETLEGIWASLAKAITGATMTTGNKAVLPEARMRPLSVEAELMAIRTAPHVWRLGSEYSFIKMFEGSSVMGIPDTALHPAISAEKKRILEAQPARFPRYVKEHNWLAMCANNSNAIALAVRNHTTNSPVPEGLQPAAGNLLISLSARSIFDSVAQTKWLITLDPLASISSHKMRQKEAFERQLKKELLLFATERLTDVPDNYSDDELSDQEEEEDDPRVHKIRGDVHLKQRFNEAQVSAISSCSLQLYTDASVSRIRDPEQVAAFKATIPTDEEAIRLLPLSEASGGAFIVVKNGQSIHEAKCSLGPLACSYSMERETILRALTYLLDNCERLLPQPTSGIPHEVALVTDSLSTLSALHANGPFRQTDGHNEKIWEAIIRLHEKGIHMCMTFVYSHLGTEWNERADILASEALSTTIQGPQWPPDVIRKKIEEITTRSDEPCGSLRWQYQIKGLSNLRKLEQLRLSSTNWKRLMQLRTDACPLLGGHLAAQSERCGLCGRDTLARSGRALNHLFECPKAEDLRKEFPQYLRYLHHMAQDAGMERDRHLTVAEQKVRDRNEFTPKLLWTNPKVALQYFDRYIALRDSALSSCT